MNEDHSYDHEGSWDSLGRRRRRGLTTSRLKQTNESPSHVDGSQSKDQCEEKSLQHELVLEL